MNDFPIQLDPHQHPWLHAASLERIFAAIEKAGGEMRVVGGAVRDALMGRVVGDIDLAVNLPPGLVSETLSKSGIKVAPTGIDHGTVTAVVDHKGYEITSLRRDVETYGRQAKVEFTDDWHEDAARRDFTFNALYADPSGKIYDYFGGRADLASGRVRFIGKAEDRIKEDVLRILRFFRFYAWFGKHEADAEGLKACHELAALLPQLSAERVWREVAKLLAAANPAPSWRLMIGQNVLAYFLPQARDIKRLERLIAVELKYEISGSTLTRLAALLAEDASEAAEVARKLKMSKRDTEALARLVVVPEGMRGKLDPLSLRRLLYEYGRDICRAASLLLAVDDPGVELDVALTVMANWQQPAFPLSGDDMIKLGLSPGPKMGAIMRSVEDWWCAKDFRPGREECLEEARKRIAAG